MPIPFPPGGPQVQSALQNPAQFPDQKLQQYAQGQQPTGQVPPPLAANELTIRNAQRQAAARQTAMQNNPANSPTIFQQKDMELQQKAQQLAAMGQQIQQKEQQLGVLGALMAKKAQDMQARESMGVANLPIRPDMFTAMDGGIVFSRGGNVERYARRGLVQDLGMLEDRMVEGFTERGMDRIVDEEEKKDPLDETIARMRKGVLSLEDAARTARLSPEEKKRRLEEAAAGDKALYEKYKQGIAGLDEETAAAIRGKPADTMQGIAAGLAALPADLRNVRLAGLMTRLAGGVAGERAKAEERENKAAMYVAEAKRKQALADFEEERGRTKRANELVASAESDLAKAYEIESGVIKAGLDVEKTIGGLQSKEEVAKAQLEARERIAAANKAADKEMANARNQVLVAQIEAKLARAGAGARTDLQTRANVAYELLKEENAKLPPDQRKSDARLRNEAFGLAENALLGSRRTSAAASMLRAEVFNSKTLTEAMNRLRYDPVYNEASATEKRELEDAVRARFPASGGMPPGAIPYPQRSNAPPPPPGFVPNSR